MSITPSNENNQNNKTRNVDGEQIQNDNSLTSPTNAASLNTILQGSQQLANLFSSGEASAADSPMNTSQDSLEKNEPVDRDKGGYNSSAAETPTDTTDPEEDPLIEPVGPAPIPYQEKKEEVPTIKANTNAYVNASITQKTQKEVGEIGETLNALASDAASNPFDLSNRSASLASYHFQNASRLIKEPGEEEKAYANIVAGYATIFGELLTTPGGLEKALNTSLNPMEAKYTAEVMTKVQSGEYALPSTSLEENTTATGRESVSSSTIANILGAFAADVIMNEVNLGEYASTVSQTSADIGKTSLDVASGQLDRLEKKIHKMEKKQKKADKWGKITQGLTVAALSVGIAVMAASVIASGGALTPVAAVTMGLMVAALAATVTDMARGGEQSSIDYAMGQMATVVQAMSGGKLSDDDAKLITALAIAVVLGAATGGAMATYGGATIGASVLAATAVSLTALSTVNFWGTASSELASELNLGQKDTMILTITMSVAALLLTMGIGMYAGGATAGSTADDTVQAGANTQQSVANASRTASTAGSVTDDAGIEMTTISTNAQANVAATTDEQAAAATTGTNASASTNNTKSASELAEDELTLAQNIANQLSRVGTATNVAAAGAGVAQGVVQGQLLQEQARFALEKADIRATMDIMYETNKVQMQLSSAVIQNYSASVQGLNASTSTFLRESADGAEALAKILGDAA